MIKKFHHYISNLRYHYFVSKNALLAVFNKFYSLTMYSILAAIKRSRILSKHISISLLAVVLLGSEFVGSTDSKNVNLSTVFLPDPSVISNVVSAVNTYTPVLKGSTYDVSGALTMADYSYIQYKDVIALPDNQSTLNGAGIVYTVKKGDSFSKIASDYGLKTSSILAANNIDSAKIKKDQNILNLHEGQQVNIPFENIDGPSDWNSIVASLAAAASTAANNRTSVSASNNVKKKVATKFLGSSGKRDYGTYSGFTGGWCTAYAAKVRPDIGDAVRDSGGGNAANWGRAARSAGLKVDRSPQAGAIGGTNESRFGHVFRIDQVSGDSVVISEYNGPAGRGVLGRREIPISMLTFVIH